MKVAMKCARQAVSTNNRPKTPPAHDFSFNFDALRSLLELVEGRTEPASTVYSGFCGIV